MGRPKVYADDAAKMRAYRERKEAARNESMRGWRDRDIAKVALDLHREMKQQVAGGRYDLQHLLGDSPAETLENIQRRLMPWEFKPL